MSWQARAAKIAIGDRVAMKASFLRNTGQFTGPIPHARGVVKELRPFGGNALALISWDTPEAPERVLVSNLSRVTARGIADE